MSLLCLCFFVFFLVLSLGEREYYEKQFATLRSFEEVDSIQSSHENITEEQELQEQAQHERAMNISNWANIFLLAFKVGTFFFFFGQFLCLLHFLSFDNWNNVNISALTLADLCNNKEWIDSDRSVDAGFSVGSDGWWDSLVHSLVNDRHKHLQIPHRKAPSSTRRHCHFRRCYGHSRCVANRDPPRAFL